MAACKVSGSRVGVAVGSGCVGGMAVAVGNSVGIGVGVLLMGETVHAAPKNVVSMNRTIGRNLIIPQPYLNRPTTHCLTAYNLDEANVHGRFILLHSD